MVKAGSEWLVVEVHNESKNDSSLLSELGLVQPKLVPYI